MVIVDFLFVFVKFKISTANNSKAFIWKTCPSLIKLDALLTLAPFAQIKQREKHPWRKVNFGKGAGWSLQLF